MDQHLINFIPDLRCPVSMLPLHEATDQDLNRINALISQGEVLTYDGRPVRNPLQEALVSDCENYVYPVLDGNIAVLLANEAVLIGENARKSEKFVLSEEKKSVQEFYDSYGWKKTKNGSYEDTERFEDRRSVSDPYWRRCHLRLNKYLPGGKYLLDIASGSIPNDEYLTYCNRYDLRICMDISFLALQEAAIRLKGKGVFIMADMVNIPLRENSIDSVISMHTVYHIPLQEQEKAVEEAYRVLKKDGQAVIVYSWENPGLMKAAFGLWRPLLKAYRSLKGVKQKNIAKKETVSRRRLFVQRQTYKWFKNEIRKTYNARLRVYSGISRSFSNTFIKEKAFGRQFSSLIFRLENMFPSFFGRVGQYPVFLLKKQADTSVHVQMSVEEPKEKQTGKMGAA